MRNTKVKLICAEVRDALKYIPDQSVHCIVTSPPYWSLRAWEEKEAIGGEKTFKEFLDHIVDIFRQMKRVLHPSGTLWVNMANSYNSELTRPTYGNQSTHGYEPHGVKRHTVKHLHTKNLIGQAWQVAFALQEDGWILRQDQIWFKSNPMPFSGTDRTVSSHEYVFQFSLKDNYYFDETIISGPADEEANFENIEPWFPGQGIQTMWSQSLLNRFRGTKARSVWIIPTERSNNKFFADNPHFAIFPKGLVEPILLASTSEVGCCPKCFAPWKRVLVEYKEEYYGSKRKRADAPGAEVSDTSTFNTGVVKKYRTEGWKRSCRHQHEQHETIPCTFLDPFNGTGTSGVVATAYRRNYVGIDISKDYCRGSLDRIVEEVGANLFTKFEYFEPAPTPAPQIEEKQPTKAKKKTLVATGGKKK